MEPLIQLIYISSEAKAYDENSLLDLLELARHENKKHGVTGLLLYHDGCFMQVIEGAEIDIDQLFANINADTTHKDLLCLLRTPIEERDFTDWSMGFEHLREDDPRGFSDYLSASPMEELKPGMARSLLLSFKVTHGLSY